MDCVATPQQNTANAWAGRMIGVGNVIGYLRSVRPNVSNYYSGYINLPKYLPALGKTQFQILCILAPISLVITVIITCVTIRESDPALLFTLPGQDRDQSGIQVAINVRYSYNFSLTIDVDEYFSPSSSNSTDL